MYLPEVVNTFGHSMHKKYGLRVHKVAINASFTCPNRDGSKGIGGCTFCNNDSFTPNSTHPPEISAQIRTGQNLISRRTGAKKFIAYFQAYTNTYADLEYLRQLYDQALAMEDVIGISVGTRPDCVPNSVLQLLASYQEKGYEVWLELGLQSALDASLQRVNRGHDFKDYVDAVKRATSYGLQICTHLIIGLPGETQQMNLNSHRMVIDVGTQGLKLHPLHVVQHTMLAKDWNQGRYSTLNEDEYITTACQLIKQTPNNVVFHRLTATANKSILLAPQWCNKKWNVLNRIYTQLMKQGAKQGCALH